MKILSIDVGIKNLALCILTTNINNSDDSNITNEYIINFWEVINLFEEQNKICEFIETNKPKKSKKSDKLDKKCTKLAKYHKNECYFCKTHANKSEYIIPTSDLLKYKRLKLNELILLTEKYKIPISEDSDKINKANKSNFIANIESFIKNKVFENTSSMKCNDKSLIDIGIAIRNKLDNLIILNLSIFLDIDIILIENQISPIANRMNCIQGMLSQYFIMKNMNNILFISAANKLKMFIEKKKTSYAERKKLGIEETKKLLLKMEDDNNKDKIIEMFNNHKKKDDLADCFLQGIWYIRRGAPLDPQSML